MSLAEKLYVCSRLLTCAAMRLSWDDDEVRHLVAMIRDDVMEKTA